MSDQRWQRIEEICHEALEHLPDCRAAFVCDACDGDEDARGGAARCGDQVLVETGRYEVYVRPFAGGPVTAEGKIQISSGGGDFPVWRPDGQELYYMSGDFTLYTVNTTELGRSTGLPLASRLFRACPGTLPMRPPMRGELYGYNYGTHERKRFLVNCAAEPPGRFVVLLNWPLTRS